jgi:ring-1,2-phenylacetyl-CoA epoxidase subunit PaaD
VVSRAASVATTDDVWRLLADVPDPEVPVVSVVDLGIVRAVDVDADERGVRVDITPTYSGCPAMDAIRHDVEEALRGAGFDDVRIRTVLAPAWTTDWISDRGRTALAEFGIAPPAVRRSGAVTVPLAVTCPRCGSPDTRELSRFGSTACKSLWRCRACGEPFDHFKVL